MGASWERREEKVGGGEPSYERKKEEGFPGDTVVRNLPANGGDMGSIPGLRRFHVPWSS